jgi:hypothetical protein
LAIFGEHAHVSACNEKDDLLAPALVADVEMTKTAEVAESDAAFGVEPVATNAVIDLGLGRRRRGFEASVESLQRGASIESPVRSLLVGSGGSAPLKLFLVRQAPAQSITHLQLGRGRPSGGANLARVA